MKRQISKYFMFCFITLVITYILLNPYSIAFHAHKAIRMCATSLVPTLFIFMVFSKMLSYLCTTFPPSNKFILFISRLLGLPPILIPVCLSGLICGAPSGAFAICRMHDEGYCTKEQAKRACIFSNNCSAAFILGFVSSVLGSLHTSLLILISSISATIIVYMIFFRNAATEENVHTMQIRKNTGIYDIFTESISSSVTATVTLCGYVIFFYTFTQVLCERLMPFFHSIGISQGQTEFIHAATSSFLEISSGVLRIGVLDWVEKIVLCAGAVSFTGLSMILQVTGLLVKSKIPTKEYFFSKFLCALVSPILIILLMLIFPYATFTSVSSNSETGGFSFGDLISLTLMTIIAFAGAYILFCLDKKHKK